MSKKILELFVNETRDRILKAESDSNQISIEVSQLLKLYLKDQYFLFSCISKYLKAINEQKKNWINPPIADDDNANFSIRLLHWPPSEYNSPHQHSNWTVSGVLHGNLVFRTYQYQLNEENKSLALDKEFIGLKGDVGYIIPPCIHSVSNQSGNSSFSLHIFSGERSNTFMQSFERGNTEWIKKKNNGLNTYNLSSILEGLINMSNEFDDVIRIDLLEKIYEMADIQTKLKCIKGLAAIDLKKAIDYLYKLAPECGPLDRERIISLAKNLSSQN